MSSEWKLMSFDWKDRLLCSRHHHYQLHVGTGKAGASLLRYRLPVVTLQCVMMANFFRRPGLG